MDLEVSSMTVGFSSSMEEQCLHFFASMRIVSAQKGQGLVESLVIIVKGEVYKIRLPQKEKVFSIF